MMRWKITIRQRWEEINPLAPERIEFAWWAFLFGVGVLVGAVLF